MTDSHRNTPFPGSLWKNPGKDNSNVDKGVVLSMREKYYIEE
jgi:hypothetical protein